MGLAILFIFLPVLIQIVIGSLILAGKIKLHFGLIALMNVLLLIGMFFVGVELIHRDLVDESGVVKCGTPFAAFFFLAFLMLILLSIVLIIQTIIRWKQKRLRNF